MLLKTCHEILVLEVIADSCSRQRVGSVQQKGWWCSLPVQTALGNLYLGRNINNMHTTKYEERYSIALP